MTNSSKFVVMVGPFTFPTADAYSLRVASLAAILSEAGFGVVIGSGQRSSPEPAFRDPRSAVHAIANLAEVPEPAWPKIRRVLRALTFGDKTVAWLDRLEGKPAAIILCGPHSGYLLRLTRWSRAKRIPLVIDMTEWFERSHLPGGAFGPFALSFELATRLLVARSGNVIAVSRFFQDYYTRKGCDTLYIPPVLDVRGAATRRAGKPCGPLTLAYVGFPGKKDLLDNVIEAVLRIDTSGDIVKLNIAGPSEGDMLGSPSIRCRQLTQLPTSIVAMGRVPHEQAMSLVRQADFTVLLRPLLRYAQAGFPSKVPESLALGTPVICNLTSDLANFIRDGSEGLVSEDHSPDACVSTLRRALQLSPEGLFLMSKAARSCAESHFDFRGYAEQLRSFLARITPDRKA